SGVLSNSERVGDQPTAFKKALYQAHGYQALISLQRDGLEAAVWQYPCNKTVLQQATGIIVHSQFAGQLAGQHYGKQAAQDWQILPLLRAQPADIDRGNARQQLAIHPEDFIICSFGLMGTTKLNQRLLQAWLDSPLIHDPHCHLIFVGGEDPSAYGQGIAEIIAASGCQTRIAITGYVSPEQYQTYLAAADLAVQLRSQSRGETSASILDCLTYGLPTLINNNGAAAELPEHALHKLPDDFTDAQLAEALYTLRTQPEYCQQLSQHAIAYARATHHPAQIVESYHHAIEQLSSHSVRSHYQQLIQTLASLYRAQAPSEQDALAIAESIAENQPGMPPKTLWVDISALVQIDLKTGIQRVVRSVLQQLLIEPPAGYRIESVYDDAGCYRHARRYTVELIGETPIDLSDDAVQFSPGDLFLGLDLYLDGTRRNHDLLMRLRHRGIQIYFVVYDLLPVLRPEVFPADTERHFHAWLDTLADVAHGLVCISQAVADELVDWLSAQSQQAGVQTAATDSPVIPLHIGHFHLGADILASAPSYGISAEHQRIMQQLHGQTNLLMVGTVEPRKGHAQALAACEILWQQHRAVNLIIVGNQGWMVDELVQRLKKHPENGHRLFWFQGISDELLMALYQAASALLAASEGEGFGLPLIEAAQHQLPIIARDLPVFIEVAGSHAYYFSGNSPQALADALLDWQAQYAEGQAPASTRMPWLTWQQSTRQLLDVLIRQQGCRQIPRPRALVPTLPRGNAYRPTEA
ncbi:MAG: glycosyltransferase, partial [Wenzhouxiangella sp.]